MNTRDSHYADDSDGELDHVTEARRESVRGEVEAGEHEGTGRYQPPTGPDEEPEANLDRRLLLYRSTGPALGDPEEVTGADLWARSGIPFQAAELACREDFRRLELYLDNETIIVARRPEARRYRPGHLLDPVTAMGRGYRIEVHGPGNATVTSPAGAIYQIRGYLCTCADKQRRNGSYRGQCKHEVWVAQLSEGLTDEDDSDPLAGLDVGRD